MESSKCVGEDLPLSHLSCQKDIDLPFPTFVFVMHLYVGQDTTKVYPNVSLLAIGDALIYSYTKLEEYQLLQ